MAKNEQDQKEGNGQKEPKAPKAPKPPKAPKGTVRMKAPKGYAAIGVPMGDAVVEVKVPKSGFIDVDPMLTAKLVEAGFTHVHEPRED